MSENGIMTYAESLAWLEELNIFGVQLGLGRIEKLLDALQHPERSYRTIHVTGTNGKGSTSAMLASMLETAGYRVGLFTSPHLSSYTERMRFNGQEATEHDFALSLSIVRMAVEELVAQGEECPTQFEVLTAQAFVWFEARRVEVAVIEVGLGGLLDSTNVITPMLSVITNVTLEHADKCGGTLQGVATHKAGIIKEGVPVVTAAQGLPLDVIKKTAAEKRAPLYVMDEVFSVRAADETPNVSEKQGQALVFSSTVAGLVDFPYTLRLLGRYQTENSAVALMAACVLRQNMPPHQPKNPMEPPAPLPLTEEQIRMALASVTWPGRFETMMIGGQRICIDGAHNPSGTAALRTALDAAETTAPRVFLLGMLADKDIDAMLRTLLTGEDEVVLAAPLSERAASPALLAEKAAALGCKTHVATSPEDAITQAFAIAGGARLLVVAGSLYLIGAVRELLQKRREAS